MLARCETCGKVVLFGNRFCPVKAIGEFKTCEEVFNNASGTIRSGEVRNYEDILRTAFAEPRKNKRQGQKCANPNCDNDDCEPTGTLKPGADRIATHLFRCDHCGTRFKIKRYSKPRIRKEVAAAV